MSNVSEEVVQEQVSILQGNLAHTDNNFLLIHSNTKSGQAMKLEPEVLPSQALEALMAQDK